MHYILPIAAVTLVMASVTAAIAEPQSAACAKIAQRYQEAVAKKQIGSIPWSEAEYWAMEGQSYCETGDSGKGVAAYQHALQALGAH